MCVCFRWKFVCLPYQDTGNEEPRPIWRSIQNGTNLKCINFLPKQSFAEIRCGLILGADLIRERSTWVIYMFQLKFIYSWCAHTNTRARARWHAWWWMEFTDVSCVHYSRREKLYWYLSINVDSTSLCSVTKKFLDLRWSYVLSHP